jgi:hypothetical protein
MSGPDPWLSDVLGNAEAAEQLGPVDPRVNRRGQRVAERNGHAVNGISRVELARHISQALRVGNEPRARELITAGGQLFGASALAAEVAEQSCQIELAALQAEQAQHAEPDPELYEEVWENDEPR